MVFSNICSYCLDLYMIRNISHIANRLFYLTDFLMSIKAGINIQTDGAEQERMLCHKREI